MSLQCQEQPPTLIEFQQFINNAQVLQMLLQAVKSNPQTRPMTLSSSDSRAMTMQPPSTTPPPLFSIEKRAHTLQPASAYKDPVTIGTPFKNKKGEMVIEFGQWKNRPDRRGAEKLH